MGIRNLLKGIASVTAIAMLFIGIVAYFAHNRFSTYRPLYLQQQALLTDLYFQMELGDSDEFVEELLTLPSFSELNSHQREEYWRVYVSRDATRAVFPAKAWVLYVRMEDCRVAGIHMGDEDALSSKPIGAPISRGFWHPMDRYRKEWEIDSFGNK